MAKVSLGKRQRASQTDIDAIAPLYQLRDAGRVRAFLQKYTSLLPLLIEAPSIIAQILSYAPQLVLEVRSDPEDDTCSELFIYIQTNRPPKEALAGLKRVIAEWLIHQPRMSNGLLGVNLEYV